MSRSSKTAWGYWRDDSCLVLRAAGGAHDADRTRDLVLTKDVLYQLSYVGHPNREL